MVFAGSYLFLYPRNVTSPTSQRSSKQESFVEYTEVLGDVVEVRFLSPELKKDEASQTQKDTVEEIPRDFRKWIYRYYNIRHQLQRRRLYSIKLFW